MGTESNSTPLISEEYKDKAGLLGLNPGAFNYYSIFGEGGMWSFPFCDTGRCTAAFITDITT
ncbi:hypothetical protein Cfor_02022 [Coptotermes formosanus]|uniref:Uncharacterized protein n=1 Tax=Coptotermes formosanus TaxID=36987 RepID=A0A6L2PYS3_COPFO|nr:hypothetical protein Cfor_02022 [Coptotermes formosanus]